MKNEASLLLVHTLKNDHYNTGDILIILTIQKGDGNASVADC